MRNPYPSCKPSCRKVHYHWFEEALRDIDEIYESIERNHEREREREERLKAVSSGFIDLVGTWAIVSIGIAMLVSSPFVVGYFIIKAIIG